VGPATVHGGLVPRSLVNSVALLRFSSGIISTYAADRCTQASRARPLDALKKTICIVLLLYSMAWRVCCRLMMIALPCTSTSTIILFHCNFFSVLPRD